MTKHEKSPHGREIRIRVAQDVAHRQTTVLIVPGDGKMLPAVYVS